MPLQIICSINFVHAIPCYQFQLCRQVHNQHYHLHLYDQKLCRQTADQTWMWTHMLVLEHTLTASLVLTAYYSCTHLQVIHYRMNYLDGFFFFFFLNIEVRSLPVTNAWKSWKQTTSLLFYHRNTTDYGAANYLILHQPSCFCQPSA